MLRFGVSAVARNKKIRALILRDIYDVADIRIGKIIFHITMICRILNYLSNAADFTSIRYLN
jgi:hypothetical protein